MINLQGFGGGGGGGQQPTGLMLTLDQITTGKLGGWPRCVPIIMVLASIICS